MRLAALLVVPAFLLPACDGGVLSNAHGDVTSGGSSGGGTGGSGGAGTSGSGASGTSGSGATCSYPPADNPPGCPASYSVTYNDQPCSSPGLECWYPGVGDVGPDGCAATALLECTTQFSDGGAAEWRAAQ